MIDNLKISKEQQALKNKEQVKAVAELESQIESLNRKFEDKDTEITKLKSQISQLRSQVNDAAKDSVKEIEAQRLNIN